MKKITDFTKVAKPEFTVLRNEILRELSRLGTELNVKFSLGNASVAPGFTEIKLIISLTNENGLIEDRAAFEFRGNAVLYGLKESDLGRSIKHGGKTVKIIGMRGGKKPIIFQDEKGGKFVTTVESIKISIDIDNAIRQAAKDMKPLNA